MFSFGKSSKSKLMTCHPDLQKVFFAAIEDSPIDFGISSGRRNAEEQNILFTKGLSKCDGYFKISDHQPKEDGFGYAVDVYAYLNNKASYDKRYLCIIAGHILGTANRLNIKIQWGGDWDSDWDMDEHDFIDMPHYALIT